MKRAKVLWPYVLAALLVFAGYFGLGGIGALLPSYKNTLREFDKANQNALFYFEQSDELVLYPWDTFDEADCITAHEELWGDYAYMKANLLQWISDMNNPSLLPGDTTAFEPPLLYQQKTGTFFVKDFRYQNAGGEACVLNGAVRKGFAVYLHCGPYENPDLTADEIRSGNAKINDYVQELQRADDSAGRELTAPAGEAFLPLSPDLKHNPLFVLLNRFGGFAFPFDSYGIAQTAPTVIPHKGNLLVIYYLDETQCILFYDPRNDTMSGFSLKERTF